MVYDNTVVIVRSLPNTMRLSTSLVFLSILSSSLLGIEKSQAEVFVTTSIRPLQLIAQAIVEDRGNVYAIIDSQDSPHNYSITPTDRINLEKADLLLRVSPDFEIFLADSFAAQSSSKPLITAASVVGVRLENLSDDSIDPHLWLNTNNALAIARQLAVELRQVDAENDEAYQEAFRLFESELLSLNSLLQSRLSQYEQSDYLVYHDAYQYFERQFGLPGGLALVHDPEVQPSMRDLLELRNQLQAKTPSCILLETDSDTELVNTALENRTIKSEIVDLLGYEIEDGSRSYSRLMLSVADSFTDCFKHSL
jgi:zinc transport system substrate-binding protein